MVVQLREASDVARAESSAAALVAWLGWFVPVLLPAAIVWGWCLRDRVRGLGTGALILGWLGVGGWLVAGAVVLARRYVEAGL